MDRRSHLVASETRVRYGSVRSDSASDRPIFTLLHAGVGGCIDKPFGRYHWQYKAWCGPDDALRADDSETTQVETVEATREAASSRKATPHTSPCANANSRGSVLIPLWQRSSKHLYEPWLTTTTASGAGSSSLRTGAGMANSEKRKRM